MNCKIYRGFTKKNEEVFMLKRLLASIKNAEDMLNSSLLSIQNAL